MSDYADDILPKKDYLLAWTDDLPSKVCKLRALMNLPTHKRVSCVVAAIDVRDNTSFSFLRVENSAYMDDAPMRVNGIEVQLTPRSRIRNADAVNPCRGLRIRAKGHAFLFVFRDGPAQVVKANVPLAVKSISHQRVQFEAQCESNKTLKVLAEQFAFCPSTKLQSQYGCRKHHSHQKRKTVEPYSKPGKKSLRQPLRSMENDGDDLLGKLTMRHQIKTNEWTKDWATWESPLKTNFDPFLL